MNEITDERLGEVLEIACAAAAQQDFPGLHYVSTALREQSSGEADDPIGALIVGLDFHYRHYAEQRDERGPFGPMWEIGGRMYPMPLAEVPEEVLEVWSQAVRVSPPGTLGARYADLLWERRFGDNAHRWARVAIDLYLQALDERFDHAVALMEMSLRAFELARRLNDPESVARTIVGVVDLARRSLDEGDAPGVSLPLLEALATERDDHSELLELVERAIEVYGEDPWHLESALELKSKLVSDRDVQRALHERVVGAFRELARNSEGIARYAHLQHAYEVAKLRGLTELAEEIRKETEGITEEELGLHEVSTSISIPKDKFELIVSQIVGDDNLEAALTRFALMRPLGDEQASLDFADEILRANPLQGTIPRMTLGPENTMIQKAENEDEHRQAAARDYEAFALGLHSHLCVEILAGIKHRYGPIKSWTSASMVEPIVVDKFLTGVASYEQGDYDAAASVLVPRIERAIRSIAQQLGFPVTGSQRGDHRLTQVKSLRRILDDLELGLPEPTHRYLKRLLVDQISLNLRNRVSHGLIDEAAMTDGALLIHAACHLSILEPAPPSAETE